MINNNIYIIKKNMKNMLFLIVLILCINLSSSFRPIKIPINKVKK